jgi:5-methylcytosine-specific restriction endonuclease McrA
VVAAGLGLQGGANAAWRRSFTTSPTNNGLPLQDAWGGCAYCGATHRPLQRDCVLPISRGGRYTLANVVPACRPCNTSKCNGEVTAWLRRKRLDERAFLLRHAELRADLARFSP